MEDQVTTPVIWKIEGRILDRAAFDTILSQLVAQARLEEATLLYWWCLDATGESYCDIDCYRDEAAAIAHLVGWAQHAEAFSRCATIESCTVYGEASEEIKERLAGLAPCYESFYAGSCKQGQQLDEGSARDVILSVEGRISDTERFHDIVSLLTAQAQVQSGARLHWWTVKPLCEGESDSSESERHFHVLLRYDHGQCLQECRQVWQSYGHLFLEVAKIDQVCVYSDARAQLEDFFADDEVAHMRWLAGFAR